MQRCVGSPRSRQAADPGPQPEGVLARLREAAGAVYRFSRPHTIRGTLLACFTGVGRALLEQPEYLGLLQTSLLPRAMSRCEGRKPGCFGKDFKLSRGSPRK